MFDYRALTHEDHQDIQWICKDNWEGADYLPSLFHRWIDEPGCVLGVVDQDTQRVVGLGRYRVLPEGTGWLEGLRVAPAYQGRGLARELTNRLMAIAIAALEKGEIKKLGMSTHADNKESIHLMEQRGFQLVQAHITITKGREGLHKELKLADFNVQPWHPTFETFSTLPYFREREGLVNLAYMFQEPTKALYEELMEQKAFLVVNGFKGFYRVKGEPYFIAIDDSFPSIQAWMDYLLLALEESCHFPPVTTILPYRQELFQQLMEQGYGTMGKGTPDYLYYLYQG